MNDKYILDGKVPVLCDDVVAWGAWFEGREGRQVASDTIDGALVSTVFLGIDHNYGEGPPILFETMIFDHPDFGDYQRRYTSWDAAEDGHREAVEMVSAS